MKAHRLFVAALCLGGASLAHAADWASWRGPMRTGISAEKGLLQEWPAAGPKLLWHSTALGSGFGTPAVQGDRLYIQSSRGVEDELIQALTVADGKPLWSTRIGGVGNPQQQPSYPGARATPTVEGSSLYAMGSDGDLVCLDTANGKARWQKNVRKEFDGKPGIWAYSESPLIDGDALICTPGGPDATLVALNKKTGALLWKCAVPGGDQASYSSPVVAEIGGVKQYVQFVQKGVVGVEAKTGRFLWRYDQTATGSLANIPTPIVRNGMVYNSSGRGGGALVRVKLEGGTFHPEQVYFAQKLPNSIGGSVLIGDHLYGTTTGGMMCVEFATGKVMWEERGVGPASVCFADGRLYVHGESNQVALVDPSPEAYREKGRLTPADGPADKGSSKAWSYPVVANGRFYVRDLSSLWCYDVKAK